MLAVFGPTAVAPARFTRFIFNRIILEGAAVRAAAVQALGEFAGSVESVKASAVELLRGYDMFASSGRDYHFYITDASGDGRVLEYDCNDPARPLTVTPSRSVTNFFVMYKDNVLPNQRNGVYGHGRERYDAIEEILDANAGSIDREIAWQALQAASQAPNPQDVTSNTQWSILYDNTALTAEAVIRRDWNTKTSYDLASNVAVTDVG